jgi:uncharacterized surface protein with fasciclin (FAS1) repeats
LKPENKKMLQTILTYHVVRKMNASDIAMQQLKGKGKATMKQNCKWWNITWMKGKNYILLMKRWYVNGYDCDVNQSNGVIHVVDAVLLPKS